MAHDPHPYEVDSAACPTVNRACESCNRKKTKCDMKRPVCGRCQRVGSRCTFPLRQKPTNNDFGSKKSMKQRISNIARRKSFGNTPNFHLLESSMNNEDFDMHLPVDILNDLQSSRASTSQDAVSGIDIPISPRDGLMQFTSSGLTPADLHQPQPDANRDMHLRTDHLNSSDEQDKGWGVPNALAVDLIRSFFDNIQPWMSIMHRPSFYDKFMRHRGQNNQIVDRPSLTPGESIMIFGMFALAARFSKAAIFDGTDPASRGETFAERAAVIKDPLIRRVEEPSVDFVKGCLLLSCHCLTAGQMSAGAILSTVCVQFAYNLGLNDIDDDMINEDGTVVEKDFDDSAEWIRREELRRVWWAISDLDTFACTILCQPFGIERRNMRVLLPVSDFAWFEGLSTRSDALLLEPAQTWKSLQSSSSQSPRSWYLVCNHLSSCIAEAVRAPSRTTLEQVAELKSALGCLRLAIPTGFQLRQLHMDSTNFADGNWTISTHLMVLTCETLMMRLTSHEPHNSRGSSAVLDLVGYGKRFTSVLVNVAQVWPPEYIPLVHPIMACAMINPWDVVPGHIDTGRIRSSDLSELLLTHISSYWKLGSASLRLLAILKDDTSESNRTPTSEERLVKKNFVVLDPSSPKRQTLTTSSARTSQASPNTALLGSNKAHDLLQSTFNGAGPSDMRWPQVNIWDHFQDFEADQSQSTLMKFSSNILPIDHSRQDMSLSNGLHHEGVSATSNDVIQNF